MDCKEVGSERNVSSGSSNLVRYVIDRNVGNVTAYGKRVITHIPIREIESKVCGYVAGILEDAPSVWMFDPVKDETPSCDPSSCGKDCFVSQSERLAESFDGTDPSFPGHL